MKRPEPFEWFVDRSLGRNVVIEALRAAGETAHAHDDHFARDTPDEDWLRQVGRRGWVVLTKDKDIRRNELERRALVGANVACFMLGHGNLSGPRMGEVFVGALPLMRRALRRFSTPVVATVTVAGRVRVLLADGHLLPVAKELG